MKTISIFLLVVLSLFANKVQAYDETRLQIVKSLLNINEIEMAYEAKLPGTQNLYAWVIAIKEIEPPQDKDYSNSYLIYTIVVDEKDNLITKIEEKKEYEDILGGVKIDTANYRLNNNTRAFGVRLTAKRVSRVVGSTDERISLMIFKDNVLKKILSDFPVFSDNKYEMFGDACSGAWDETTTVFIISDQKTRGFNNIVAKTKTEYHNQEDGDIKNCKDKVINSERSSKLLKFNGEIYE